MGSESGAQTTSPLPKELTPQADAFLRQLLAGQPLFAFIQDAELRYVWTCNQIGGWVQHVFVGLSQDQLPNYDPAYLERLKERKLEVLRTGEPVSFEELRPMPDGTHIITGVTYSRYEFEDGSYGIFGRLLDLSRIRSPNEAIIDMHKRLHVKVHQLQEAEQRFKLAMAEEPILISLVDEDDRIIWLNKTFPSWKLDEVMGRTHAEVGLPPEQAAIYTRGLQQVRATGEDFHTQAWLVANDGQRYYVRIHIQPTTLPNDRIGMLVKTVDMTEQKQHEDVLLEANRRLNETERRFTAALADEPLTLYITDENDRYLWVYKPQPPWTPEMLIGLNDYDIGMEKEAADRYMNAKKQVRTTGNDVEIAGWVGAEGGLRTFKRMRLRPFALANGKVGVLGKDLDMTPQQELFESLKDINSRLVLQGTASRSQNFSNMERLTQESAHRLAAVDRLTVEAIDQAKLFRELSEQSQQALSELNAAREMQRSMLPRDIQLPDIYDVAAIMETSIQVGGDYYDYLPLDNSGMVAALGDATGHGVKAGILVAAVRSYFQLMGPTTAPAKLLASVNKAIQGMQLHRTYMGLTMLCIHGRTLTFASAGMPPLMVWRKATGKVESHLIKGLFLGTDIPQAYTEQKIELEEGDVVACISDGYYEARNEAGIMLSPLSMMDVLAKHAARSPESVIAALRILREAHTGTEELEDDATCLVIRIR